MKIGRKTKLWILSIIMFHLGYEASNNDFFPVTHFFERHFGSEEAPQAEPTPTLTSIQRLHAVYSDVSDKKRIECPNPDKALVIAIFGQSNAANAVGHRFSTQDERLINFYNGYCYVASDPMLGTSGIRGSVWIPFLEMLDSEKDIVVVNFAIGGSSIQEWLDPQSLASLYSENLQILSDAGFLPDLFIWVQGETNTLTLTPPKKYEKSLQALILKVKSDYPNAQMAISGTSYCQGKSNQEITQVQRRVALFQNLIWLGNTDEFNSFEHRYDDCHFSGDGAKAVATMFSEAINKELLSID